MRLFQNSGLYASYRPRLASLSAGCRSFADHVRVFLGDRFGAPHFLQPVLAGDASAFFTNGDHLEAQQAWAREQGLPADTGEAEILLAQIEHHRTEVFYNLDPMRHGAGLLTRLPGCVKRRIAWRAAPSADTDLSGYDAVVCNFPGILDRYRNAGWRAAYFAPAHDPELDAYAANTDRPIDVLFVGGYSRHHRRRAAVLEAVAALRGRLRIEFRLDRSRLTRLAESPLGRLLPLGAHRRPADIRAVSAEPVFGRDLYQLLSRAKIVLNGAVDMAGDDRGNMRCFEAMGARCLLLSDAGRYPQGMEPGKTLVTYDDADAAARQLSSLVAQHDATARMASAGHALMHERYSKARQWSAFVELAGA